VALAVSPGADAQVPASAGTTKRPVAGDVIRLWPEGVPGAVAGGGPEIVEEGRVSNVHDPTLTAFPAPSAAAGGAAVIVCPGGGYVRLAVEKEGAEAVRWLNELGVSAYVLKYRLKEYGHPAPLRDALRAIRLARANAEAWGHSPDRIGVIGFSAGGHLAASAGTLYDAPEGRTGASLDAVSGRPDFMILVYPVILMDGPHVHAGSRAALLGAAPPAALVARLSLDTQVTPATPPAFLVHGGTDTSVPAENSLAFFAALRRAGVPTELHVYQQGAHGIGFQPGHGAISSWPARDS